MSYKLDLQKFAYILLYDILHICVHLLGAAHISASSALPFLFPCMYIIYMRRIRSNMQGKKRRKEGEKNAKKELSQFLHHYVHQIVFS